MWGVRVPRGWGRGGTGEDRTDTRAHPPNTAHCPAKPPCQGRTERNDPKSHLSLKDLISEPVRNVLEHLNVKNKLMKCVWENVGAWASPLSKPWPQTLLGNGDSVQQLKIVLETCWFLFLQERVVIHLLTYGETELRGGPCRGEVRDSTGRHGA